MNPVTKKIIADLSTRGHKEQSKFMLELMRLVGISTRKRAEVNVSKLDRLCKKDEMIIVPGKVLSAGMITKPITISALKFSKEAEEKIKKAGGQVLTIPEMLKNNSKGTKIRMIR
ncbi:MAG: 50S ribosomal protein L18e [bacterium]